jgi:hypothetical protein
MASDSFADRQIVARNNGGPVYKFRKFDAVKDVDPEWQGYLASILRDGLLYVPGPGEFNDPWETRPAFVEPDAEKDPESVAQFKEQLLALGTSKEHREQLLAGLEEFGYRSIVHAMQDGLTKEMRDIGIYCVTGNCISPLMWSYYGNGHAGFCIEFNEKADPFANAIKVTYDPAYPMIDWRKGRDSRTTEKCVLTKADFWDHEDEYRIVVPSTPTAIFPTVEHNGLRGEKPAGRYLKIDPAAVTGLVFGGGMRIPEIATLIGTAEKMGRRLVFRQAGIGRASFVVKVRTLSERNIAAAKYLAEKMRQGK